MSRRGFKVKTLGLLPVVILSIIALLASAHVSPVQAASSDTDATKPMEFYFHYIDTPVSVAGLQTSYIMNTTQSFRFLTQQEAHANSFYKPVGQPKIVVAFYLYPDLADPITLDGTWQVFVWVNGSAYKPITFALQFKEITPGGVTLWDSGPINPIVTSTIGSYITVPVHSYNLSAPVTHTFNAETTLLVSIEVNTGSSADARIWYDSPHYPSKTILPATDSVGGIWTTAGFLLLIALLIVLAVGTIGFLYKRGVIFQRRI